MKIGSFRVGAAGFVLALTLGVAPPTLAEGVDANPAQTSGALRADRPRFSPGFERRGGYAYYNGHRGYRRHRDGYREHNGWWFPLAAFAAGALIVGAAPPAPVVVAPNPHVDWCRAHYRSYNPYDNTFQPHYGPRAYCLSPYS